MNETAPLAVMTADDPRWEEFRSALQVRLDGVGGCKSDRARPHARAVLEAFGGYDVHKSFKYFSDNGGCCCDCEIIMNVGVDHGPRPERRRKKAKPSTFS